MENSYSTSAIIDSGSFTVPSQKVDSHEYYAQTVRFYDNCALLYDDLYPDHIAASRKVAESVASLFKGSGVARILDASCGLGHDIESFSAYGFHVDGADISPEMLNIAAARLARSGLTRTTVHLCDVRALHAVFAKESYDAVLLRGNTLSNLNHADYKDAFLQIASVLRPHGLFYFDFRDGEPHYHDKRRFEFRGFHIDITKRVISVAWYQYLHGANICDAFHVLPTVMSFGRFKGRRLPIRVYTLQIKSHYVPTDTVFPALTKAGLNVLIEVDTKGGLPYLRTYIARKI